MDFATRSNMKQGYDPIKVDFPKCLPKYGYEIDAETGEKVVAVVGHTNVYAQKQEAVKDTYIYNMIDRINRTGDFSLLGENLGGFIDVTNMPKNLMEAENVRVKARQIFDSLPMEKRSDYGNDFNLFLKDVNVKLSQKAPSVSKAPAVSRQDVVNPTPQEVNNG